VKVIDKTPARTTKRNAPAEAPASKAPAATEGRGGRRGGFNGNEGGQLIPCAPNPKFNCSYGAALMYSYSDNIL